MPEYLSPGVYVEEPPTSPRPIEGVGTAMAAFIGFAAYSEAADVNKPVLITNWSQYVERFGRPDEYGRRDPHLPGAYLSHAVYGYFQNGGGRCYVTRVLPPKVLDQKPKQLAIKTVRSDAENAITIAADGAIPANIRFVVEPPDGELPRDGTFVLRVQIGREDAERYTLKLGQRAPAQTPAPDTDDGAAEGGVTAGEKKKGPPAAQSAPDGKTVLKELKVGKTTVTISEVASTTALAERLPKPGAYQLEMPQDFAGADVGPRQLEGDVRERSGVQGMEIAEDVTMICFPDLLSPLINLNVDRVKAVQAAMIDHCERMQDRMAILDAPRSLDPQKMLNWRRDSGYNSKFAALYYPWITVMGPDNSPMDIPPCGHIAGIYARNDNTRGVHKAPANEPVRGILRVAQQITKGEQDLLNPEGVNCIRVFSSSGPLVWGARTLSSDPAWRYINVRRLFNYVEKSIERGTQWVVFEPNNYDLWARVRRDVGAFLTGCWREGMLFGRSPEEAFFVKCDEELNPPDVRDRGQLIIEVGLAPVKPAEFVIFRFSQLSGGGA